MRLRLLIVAVFAMSMVTGAEAMPGKQRSKITRKVAKLFDAKPWLKRVERGGPDYTRQVIKEMRSPTKKAPLLTRVVKWGKQNKDLVIEVDPDFQTSG